MKSALDMQNMTAKLNECKTRLEQIIAFESKEDNFKLLSLIEHEMAKSEMCKKEIMPYNRLR